MYKLKFRFDIDMWLAYLICYLSIQCSNNSTVLFVFVIAWLSVALLKRPLNFKRELLNMECIHLYLFLLLILFFCSLYGEFHYGIGNMLRYLSLFFGGLIFRYYRNIDDKLDKLVKFTLIIWMYFSLKSIYFLSINPGAARLIVSHQGTYFEEFPIGRAYGLNFGSVIVALLLLSYICSKKLNLINKLFCIICVIISSILCIKTESTLTIIIYFLGLLITFILNNAKNSRKKILIFVFIIFIVCLLISMRTFIGKVLVNWNPTGSFNIDERIHEIGRFFIYLDYSGVALGGRIEAYLISVRTIINRPIFGSITQNGYPTSIGVSGHSELLDIFALYGFFVGLTFLLWYKNNIHYKNNKSWVFIGCEIATWLLLIVNQFAYTAGTWFVFFLIPTLKKLYFDNGFDQNL